MSGICAIFKLLTLCKWFFCCHFLSTISVYAVRIR
uniref:Uncharacterized protein n=1 Tax=Anguilla anguilla TaxID=7936 RepID=A0A0E9VZF2_ANGAN